MRSVDFEIAAGEIVTIFGHDGAGKTTLLRAMFGLTRPRAGEVRLAGSIITGRAPSLNIADGLAMVPQGHGIFRTLSVLQNLELGGFEITQRALVEERLERVYSLFPLLKERRRQIGGTLSGGQQQMLAIGMALMSEPRVLLLDEPSIGLAPLLVERVTESIREINASYGTTILLVEQNLKQGLTVAHRAVVLNRGEKRFDGDPAALTPPLSGRIVLNRGKSELCFHHRRPDRSTSICTRALASSLFKGATRYYVTRFRVGVPEMRMLSNLGREGPLAAHQFVALTAMDKAIVSRVLAALARRSYIAPFSSETDPRRRIWQIAASGNKLVNRLRPVWRKREAIIQADLSPDEQAHLISMLQRMFEASERLRDQEAREVARDSRSRRPQRKQTRAFSV